MVGEANVGSPALLDTHRPGEFQMRRFVARPEQVSAISKLAPLKIISPVRGDSQLSHFSSGTARQTGISGDRRPARLIFQGKRGEVLAAAGPWRTSGDWWREDPWDQDEWDLEVQFPSAAKNAKAKAGPTGPRDTAGQRGRYRIYYDALSKSWFARGMYD